MHMVTVMIVVVVAVVVNVVVMMIVIVMVIVDLPAVEVIVLYSTLFFFQTGLGLSRHKIESFMQVSIS